MIRRRVDESVEMEMGRRKGWKQDISLFPGCLYDEPAVDLLTRSANRRHCKFAPPQLFPLIISRLRHRSSEI